MKVEEPLSRLGLPWDCTGLRRAPQGDFGTLQLADVVWSLQHRKWGPGPSTTRDSKIGKR